MDNQRDVDKDEDYGLCRNCGYRCSSIMDKTCEQCQAPIKQQSDPEKDIMSPPRNKKGNSKSSRQTGRHRSKQSTNSKQAKGKAVKEQLVDDDDLVDAYVESLSIQLPSEETRTSTGTGSVSSTNLGRM